MYQLRLQNLITKKIKESIVCIYTYCIYCTYLKPFTWIPPPLPNNNLNTGPGQAAIAAAAVQAQGQRQSYNCSLSQVRARVAAARRHAVVPAVEEGVWGNNNTQERDKGKQAATRELLELQPQPEPGPAAWPAPGPLHAQWPGLEPVPEAGLLPSVGNSSLGGGSM